MNRIAVYSSVRSVFDTTISCPANGVVQLLVKFRLDPETRLEIRQQRWAIAQKSVFYVAAIAALPIGFSGLSDKRKDYLECYDRLQKTPGYYDEATSLSAVKGAKATMVRSKSDFATAKKVYRNACVKAGASVLISGSLFYLAAKTKIPVVHDRAILRFDAISFNTGTYYPGINFTVQL